MAKPSIGAGTFDMYVRRRVPWRRPEDYEHMLDWPGAESENMERAPLELANGGQRICECGHGRDVIAARPIES